MQTEEIFYLKKKRNVLSSCWASVRQIIIKSRAEYEMNYKLANNAQLGRCSRWNGR